MITRDVSRRAAQYLRMSTDSQIYSLDNQAAAISEFAVSHGLEVVQSYVDAGRGGVTTRGRSGLAALLADIVSGQVDYAVILVLDVSRWGRYQDPDEAAHYEFLCRSAGVDVRYCGENFGDGPNAAIMKQLKRVMAGEYSRELSMKVRGGRRRHEVLGHSPGSACPYGIQRQEMLPGEVPGRMLERSERKSRPENSVRYAPGVPAEQAVARLIFHLYVRRAASPAKISNILNTAGHLWTNGTPWTNQRVYTLLDCDLLAGRQWAGKYIDRIGQCPMIAPQSEWRLARTFEPVVSPKIFDAAQRRKLELNGSRGVTEREMLKELRRILAKRGRLSFSIIDAETRSSCASTYHNKFGSLTRAYAAIGYEPDIKIRGCRSDGTAKSRDEVIQDLRRLEQQRGSVSTRLITSARWMSSCRGIRKEFGSMAAAYVAAGVRQRAAGHHYSCGE